MWNKSCSIATPAATAIMAKTEDEAPRSPAQEINPICSLLHFKGTIKNETAIGLAIKVRITTITNAFGAKPIICFGKVNKPNRKKIIICAKLVTPSKNGIKVFL